MNSPVVGDYRDRSTGLTVFGVLEILFGALCLLLVPLAAIGMVASARRAGTPVSPQMLAPALGFYGGAGTVCIWLGIGSILARRWARALWVCLSGFGLATGVLATPLMVYVAFVHLPRTMATVSSTPPPAVAMFVAQAVTVAMMVLFYLVIPGVLFWFYTRPDVKRTCAARDPRERWTDRCPLPVLTLSLMSALGGVFMALVSPFFRAFPFFGVFLSGVGAVLLMLAWAALALWVAWGLYRLWMAAWWVWLATLVFMAVSSTLTMWHADIAVLYAQMGMQPEVVVRASELGRTATLWGMLCLVPWLAWGLYVRRFFPKPAPAAISGA